MGELIMKRRMFLKGLSSVTAIALIGAKSNSIADIPTDAINDPIVEAKGSGIIKTGDIPKLFHEGISKIFEEEYG